MRKGISSALIDKRQSTENVPGIYFYGLRNFLSIHHHFHGSVEIADPLQPVALVVIQIGVAKGRFNGAKV